MKKHSTSVHEGKKPFKCDFCEYRCSLNQQMKQHVTKKHEGNKVWNENHIQSVHVQEKKVSVFVHKTHSFKIMRNPHWVMSKMYLMEINLAYYYYRIAFTIQKNATN